LFLSLLSAVLECDGFNHNFAKVDVFFSSLLHTLSYLFLPKASSILFREVTDGECKMIRYYVSKNPGRSRPSRAFWNKKNTFHVKYTHA